LRGSPGSQRIIAINLKSQKFPSASKTSAFVNSKLDYARVSNCKFMSRRYAEHIETSKINPSVEEAKKEGFIVSSMISGLFHSPVETVQESTILKFAIVGATGVVINYLVVAAFKYFFSGINLVFGDASGIELSIVNNFILNDRFTFSQPGKVGSGSLAETLGRFAKYNLVSLLSSAVNLGVFYYLNTLRQVFWVWSLLVAILVAFVVNYLGSSRWAWRESRSSR
ncbi:MAG TPA: GtrA family protein, partial [Nitrososphaerales archaeon]|nr:GtrA family protein [Nitrososphaerales archaeon]